MRANYVIICCLLIILLLVAYYNFQKSLEISSLDAKQNIKDGKLFNLGLWKSNSCLNFYEKTDTADSSFIKNNNFLSIKKTRVISLDSLNIKNIKLLKVEAEGAEPEVLMGSKNILKKIKFITIDCGPERGLAMKKTDLDVVKFLKMYKFLPIAKSKIRDVILFKNINY